MKNMQITELKKHLEKQEVFLIDVREPFEYNVEFIEGACLIPLTEISLEKLPSQSNPVVIYCRSGKRSSDACKKLLMQDPNLELYSLEGGIIAWQQAGFATKKAPNNLSNPT